ncbi:MAG: fimbrillin family protein [Bacteroides sp.]|nr:fimbrillin family protein [Bacteroides sp.]
MNRTLLNDLTEVLRKGCILFGLVLLAACDEATEAMIADTEETTALNFAPSIAATVETRTAPITGNKFPNSRTYSLGFWVCKHEEETDYNQREYVAAMTDYNNLKATLSIGAATGETDEEIWKYTFSNLEHDTLSVRRYTSVDVYAYHPYTSATTSPTAVPFTSGQSDWMYADPYTITEAQTAGSRVEVPMVFHHTMTSIQVNIICRYDGTVDLTRMTLTDTKGERLGVSGTMNATNGELTDITKGSSISISPNTRLNNATYTTFCIIMPAIDEYADGEFELSFQFDNNDMAETYSLPTQMNKLDENGDSTGETVTIDGFKKGVRYIYNVELNNYMHFTPVGVDETAWSTESRDLEL